jgi:hypothetical protein
MQTDNVATVPLRGFSVNGLQTAFASEMAVASLSLELRFRQTTLISHTHSSFVQNHKHNR